VKKSKQAPASNGVSVGPRSLPSPTEPSLSAGVSPLLHDISTTAKLMSTTTFAVRQLCRAGQLKYVRIGHRWLISPQAIQRFISQAENTGGAA